MAVQVELQRSPLVARHPAEAGRPAARLNLAYPVAIPLFRGSHDPSQGGLRRAAVRRRRLARRVRGAAELTAWLSGSAFLMMLVLGGLAGLH